MVEYFHSDCALLLDLTYQPEMARYRAGADHPEVDDAASIQALEMIVQSL
jgi:hypothetical protein